MTFRNNKSNINKIFKFDSRKILLIYDGYFDKIIYCYWLSRKINPTHKIKYIGISHKLDNNKNSHVSTHILINFSEKINVSNSNYFDYCQMNPYIEIVESLYDFNVYKKYVGINNDYTKFLDDDVILTNIKFRDVQVFIKKYIYLTIELYILEELFKSKINSNKDFAYIAR